MLNLSSKIVLNKEAIESPNLCDRFKDEDLTTLGGWVWDGYNRDKYSRSKWEQRTSAAMDLAMQVLKDKNYPWPNCANIAFPLVTIAALQFHARAYPTVVSGTDVVKCRVIGEDVDGAKKQRADRISTHMSWQCLEQDGDWEEQHDRLLINLPIVGCAFKKSYWCSTANAPDSELVLARDLVLDYYSKSVEYALRKTHTIPFPRNDIYERVKRGTFRDILDEAWYRGLPVVSANTLDANKDRRTGMNPPVAPDETTPFQFLEQHVSCDLDGDGYAEPYIMTVEESSKCLVRIVARFDREEDIERNIRKQIVTIRPIEYFTKYSFVPSPDGGVYDVGFGLFLGPLNESVNSLVNMLIDSGSMAVGGGGFLGRGAKIRGGVYTFAPFEWKRVDSPGDDLRKNIVPLDVREPSQVLFNLLTLLINYTQRISGSTDIMVGENIGQNTPKGTADTLVEQGQKIYNAIFKRVWRCMKEEFKKLYILNAVHLPTTVNFGQGRNALREDYLGDPNTVAPAADPNIVSDGMNMQIASAVLQRAGMVVGYDKDAVERNWLKAMKVDGMDSLFKGSNGQPPPKDVKLQIAELELQAEAQEGDKERQHEMGQFMMEMQEEHLLNQAKIMDLSSRAQAVMMDQQGDQADRQVAMMQSQLKYLEQKDKQLGQRMQLLLGQMEITKKQNDVEVAAKKGAIDLHVAAGKGAIALDLAKKKSEQTLAAGA